MRDICSQLWATLTRTFSKQVALQKLKCLLRGLTSQLRVMGLSSIFLCKALATEAACSICTGLPGPDIISSRANLLLQVAELLLNSDDLEAVAGDVERLLQQAKEADPANFEYLQVTATREWIWAACWQCWLSRTLVWDAQVACWQYWGGTADHFGLPTSGVAALLPYMESRRSCLGHAHSVPDVVPLPCTWQQRR